jgi:phage-related protein
MKKRCMDIKQYSVVLALAGLLCTVPSVSAQAVPPGPGAPAAPTQYPGQGNGITSQELASFDTFLDGHPEIAEQVRKNPSLVDDRDYVNSHPELQAYLQDHPRVHEELTKNPRIFMRKDDRLNDRELASLDTFLNSHPEIAEQLRKNPTLADNKEFLQNHPALGQFLQQHPAIQEQFAQDPGDFMKDEDRFGRRGGDATGRELASFDAFLDGHPDVAQQLRKNPTLADNKEFLQSHPELQQFLQDHPGVRQQMAQDPRIFMREDDRLNGRELATLDTFLNSHPEIAEQLRKNPTLADNKEFLQSHPALQQFLQEHPAIQVQFKQDPGDFMKDEDRFGRRGDDATGRELAGFDAFLDGHPDVAEQLRKNPTLADNREFLQNHPDLQQFLQDHPGVRQQMAQDPRIFMKEDDRLNGRELATLDTFLNSHPEIAEQLRKNPTLADNKEFLQNHPALGQFLQEHPAIQVQFKQDPGDFMKDEDRFGQRGNEVSRREVNDFDGFLNSHPEIAQQLSKDPSLAKNGEYLQSHPELQDYLKTHTGVQEQLTENPQAFTNSTKQFDNTGTKQEMTDPKPKP